MSQTIAVCPAATTAGTVDANMWEDAANPCVSSTAGPSPVTSLWMCTPLILPVASDAGRPGPDVSDTSSSPLSGTNSCQKRERAATTAATWAASGPGVSVRSGDVGGS